MDKVKNKEDNQNMSTYDLQKTVTEYRKQMPELYSILLKKEREIINRKLKETKFVIDSKTNVELKPNQKSFLDLKIDTESFQNKESKLIQLNSKVDDLLKCMQYVKK